MTVNDKVTTNPVKQTREQSTIAFPYSDLMDAVNIAKCIHGIGGTGCDLYQLAGRLNTTTTGGSFRSRMAAAKMFGVIEQNKGDVNLTTLGKSLCDTQKERAAKVQAFLNVPLYLRVYEEFRDSTLPPTAGLETKMMQLGVATKQASKARRAFHNSADAAGFFESNRDRLVKPVVSNNGGGQDGSESEIANKDAEKSSVDSGSHKGHPLIDGLLKTIPKVVEDPKTEWTIHDRRNWLKTAAGIFDLLFQSGDGDQATIKISIEQDYKEIEQDYKETGGTRSKADTP